MNKVIYINHTLNSKTEDVALARRWIESGHHVTAAAGL